MSTLRAGLAERVAVADGAIGTMLQVGDAACDDFAGRGGCAGFPSLNRLDILAGTHGMCLKADAEYVMVRYVTAGSGQLWRCLI
jgi:methionine synthase I (cobalamin-dependent)